MARILLIEDEPKLRELLTRILALEGHEISTAENCRQAVRKAEQFDPDIILSDVRLPDGNGVELIPVLRKVIPTAEIIVMTAYGNIPDGIQAIRNGAFDYITKGDDNNKILPLVERAAEKSKVARQLQASKASKEKTLRFDQILGNSARFREVAALAQKVCNTDTSVLLTGETGTGKEVMANAIHYNSNRASKPFLSINCAAFSRELLESELFGYKAGAFTGANKDKRGFLEEAHTGTLFLDEVGEMSADLQAKLLRVIESGEYTRVGDTRVCSSNIRYLFATHRDLRGMVRSGQFREDLFYRISMFEIHMPALRERKADIRALAEHFLNVFSFRIRGKPMQFDDNAIEILEQYTWPGNIRELRNVVERAVILSDGDMIYPEYLPYELRLHDANPKENNLSLSAVERRHILHVLGLVQGNKSEAAKLLGIGLTTLYRKLEEIGIK